MKLKRKNNKKIVVIVLAVVVLLAVIGVIAWAANQTIEDNKLREVQEIIISNRPKSEYYVGESFDPTGLRLYAVAGTNEYSYFVDYPNSDIKISGFDSSVANDSLPVTISYMGLETTLFVKIKDAKNEVPPYLVSIEICDFVTTYDMEYWNEVGPNPSASGAYIKLVYSDGSTYGDPDKTPLSRRNIYDYEKVTAPGTTQIRIKYSENGISKEETITITITETITE